ncbi:MAG: thiolase family protein [Steroidobacteraceae bacterium]|nr:thiolase family protein [Steroidobacteraceae bacterium]
MTNPPRALVSQWNDVWLLAGVRTPFVDYTQAFSLISPIDLGIKAAREVFARSGLSPEDVGTVIAASMAQTSYDAYLLPRHIGLYAGVPTHVPAQLVQRVCGSGIEIIGHAADTLALGRASLALCTGAESMSRNPIAAYTHRSGFRLGAPVEFKDFLWEALMDPAVDTNMGGTAENLARRYDIRRSEVDAYAARSFERALAAQSSGFLAGEICPVKNETFEVKGLRPRSLRLTGKEMLVERDTHIRPTSLETLAKIRPAFGGVQTGGNSSAIVDGAAAALVGSGEFVKRHKITPLARIVAAAAVGVPPEVMGIGPVSAIRALLAATGLKLAKIDRIEINEAFGAQVLACVRELGIDEARLNVNGGAIALGHPLGATGVRLVFTLARELQRAGARYGIASACIGGGQGIAMLLERA